MIRAEFVIRCDVCGKIGIAKLGRPFVSEKYVLPQCWTQKTRADGKEFDLCPVCTLATTVFTEQDAKNAWKENEHA